MEPTESCSQEAPAEDLKLENSIGDSNCSKDEYIAVVTNWYRDEFWKYLRSRGMIPLKTCHDEIIKQLQEKIQKSISTETNETIYFNRMWEHWEEIREKLSAELAYNEKIVEVIFKAEDLSVSQYSASYESEIITLLEARVTDSEVNSLKSEILRADEDYLKMYLGKIDERCHKIVQPHLLRATRDKLKKIIVAENVFNSYNGIMRVYFENFVCFSDESFGNAHRNASNRSLEEFTLNRVHLKHLDNHVLSVARQNYEKSNKIIRENETKTILKILQDVDEFYMEKLLSKQVYKLKDIKTFHENLIGHLIQVANKSFDVKKRGFDLLWLKKNLDEKTVNWIKTNDRKMENALKLINTSVSEVEVMFTEAMKFELLKKALAPFEFELVLKKRKAEAFQQIESKLQDSLPAGRRKQIQQLENQINKLSEELKLENSKKFTEEESKKCPTPILLIEFGPKLIRVGYVDGVLKTGSFENLKRLKNFVTFTTSGETLVGMTSPDKIYEISVENLVLTSANGNYPERIDLPAKMIEIPVNLQFISSIILTFIKETVENDNIEFPSVVITIPLWFATHHRLAIKNAAIVAGFKQVFLINDLSAAALTHYSRQRSMSISLNEQSTENHVNPPILIIAADDDICYAGLFQKKSPGDEHPATMLYNIGNFHLPPSKDIHSGLVTNMINVYPNITQVIICSDIPNLETVYGQLIKSKIPSCTNYMAIEHAVLQGAAKYSELLADKVSAAKTSIHGKTFYHLHININSNSELMKRNTDLNVYVDSRHTIDTTGKTQLCIYETPDGRSRQRFIVDNLIYEGKKGDKIQLTCATDHEGYFDVHTSGGSLLLKEERQKVTAEYTQLIHSHFRTDKEFELIRKNLIDIANYMLQFIEIVPAIMRDQIQEEGQEALQLAKQINAQKELVQEKMEILQKFKNRYYNPLN